MKRTFYTLSYLLLFASQSILLASRFTRENNLASKPSINSYSFDLSCFFPETDSSWYKHDVYIRKNEQPLIERPDLLINTYPKHIGLSSYIPSDVNNIILYYFLSCKGKQYAHYLLFRFCDEMFLRHNQDAYYFLKKLAGFKFNILVKDYYGKTLFDTSRSLDYEPIAKMIITHDKCTPKYLLSTTGYKELKTCELYNRLIYACKNGNQNIVKMVVEREMHIPENHELLDIKKDHNSSLLLHACKHGYKDIAKMILAHDKCTPEYINLNKGSTALMYACQYGHEDIVNMLLHEYNADLSIDTDRANALLLAIDNGHKSIATMLLYEPNIDIHKYSCIYGDALILSAKKEMYLVTEILLQKNVNTYRRDSRNMCAYDYIKNKCNGISDYFDKIELLELKKAIFEKHTYNKQNLESLTVRECGCFICQHHQESTLDKRLNLISRGYTHVGNGQWIKHRFAGYETSESEDDNDKQQNEE